LRPSGSFSLDLGDQVVDRGLGAIKDALVALLPQNPEREQGSGAIPLCIDFGMSCLAFSHQPMSGDGQYPQPGKHLMPNLAGQGAFHHEMVYSFRRFITEQTSRMVLQCPAVAFRHGDYSFLFPVYFD
jgi:hypothetical protein